MTRFSFETVVIRDLGGTAAAGVSPAILGGTELSLILCDETVFGVRILGTTQISVEAAVARLISGGAIVPIAEGRETPGAIDKSIARQLMFLLE